MPLGKRTKSYDVKRNVRQRRTPLYRTPLISTPHKQTRKLRYFGRAAINAPAALSGVHVCAANDLYDPDVTGVGHQPVGFDQMMEFYTHFKVLSSKITVWFTSEGNPGSPLMCAVSLKSVNTTGSSITRVIENGDCSFDLKSNHALDPSKLTKSFNLDKWLPNQKYDQRTLGTSSSSPTEVAYYHINVEALDGSSDPGSMIIGYVIDYVAEFTEKKQVNIS